LMPDVQRIDGGGQAGFLAQFTAQPLSGRPRRRRQVGRGRSARVAGSASGARSDQSSPAMSMRSATGIAAASTSRWTGK
jgi:hypothetical protein